jgi:hypothetical protein
MPVKTKTIQIADLDSPLEVEFYYEPYKSATWDEPSQGELEIQEVLLNGEDILDVLSKRVILNIEQELLEQ